MVTKDTIKLIRKVKNWSTEEFGDAMGKSKRTIEYYEGGGKIPKSTKLLINSIMVDMLEDVKKILKDF